MYQPENDKRRSTLRDLVGDPPRIDGMCVLAIIRDYAASNLAPGGRHFRLFRRVSSFLVVVVFRVGQPLPSSERFDALRVRTPRKPTVKRARPP